ERAAEDDPLRALAQRERAGLVRDALARLLPDDPARGKKLRAVRLRHFEGWPLVAIRAELGAASTNALAHWLHRVRKAPAAGRGGGGRGGGRGLDPPVSRRA